MTGVQTCALPIRMSSDVCSSDLLALEEDYGKFALEPLERGFATTVGNSLRRVLLSSLPGVAVTAIKIDKVMHKFSTVKGVKEDVTELMLTLKELSMNMDSNGEAILRIDAQGECEITVGDSRRRGGACRWQTRYAPRSASTRLRSAAHTGHVGGPWGPCFPHPRQEIGRAHV